MSGEVQGFPVGATKQKAVKQKEQTTAHNTVAFAGCLASLSML